jgi:hypothetical protein
MKVLKFSLALLSLFLVCQSLSAQYRYGYFRVGTSVGSTHYLGDLDDDFTFRFTKPGVGLSGSYRLNPFMTARLNFFQGWIRASDSVSNNVPRNRRNLSFRTPITEFSFHMVFDFLPSDRQYQYRPLMTPYVFGGIGIFSFNPQAQLGGRWYDLQPLGTEGQYLPDPNEIYPDPYKLTQLTIPLGTGVRIAIAPRWDLEIETGFRKTFTDYIDDVSGEYPDMESLRAQNPVAAILADRIDLAQFPAGGAATNGIRGDRTQQDWYVYTCVRLNFVLDWVRCPTFN